MGRTADLPIYTNGAFWVLRRSDGKGFEVYRDGVTVATRCALIAFVGEEGFRRAKAECDRRADLAKVGAS